MAKSHLKEELISLRKRLIVVKRGGQSINLHFFECGPFGYYFDKTEYNNNNIPLDIFINIIVSTIDGTLRFGKRNPGYTVLGVFCLGGSSLEFDIIACDSRNTRIVNLPFCSMPYSKAEEYIQQLPEPYKRELHTI